MENFNLAGQSCEVGISDNGTLTFCDGNCQYRYLHKKLSVRCQIFYCELGVFLTSVQGAKRTEVPKGLGKEWVECIYDEAILRLVTRVYCPPFLFAKPETV
jgi:hypothetical protein